MGKTEAAEKAALAFVRSKVLFQQDDFKIHWLCAMPSGFCRCWCTVVFYEYDHYTNIVYYMVVRFCDDMAVAQAVAERHLDLHKQLMNKNANFKAKKMVYAAGKPRKVSTHHLTNPTIISHLSPRKAHCSTREYTAYLG